MKQFDNSFLNSDIRLVAGCDEAGRGPLAGPVVAAAVVFDPDIIIPGVDDSKKLSESRREELYPEILLKALSVKVAVIENEVIDKINILNASLTAMKKACEQLDVLPDLIIADGNKSFFSAVPVLPVVKGDSKSFAIAAASIVSKVTRDRIMRDLSLQFPYYRWDKNKGYATKEHIEAIRVFGTCKYHRRTFLGKIILKQQSLDIF
ncbi:MAG: ribonuclease HII [Ignavibacteriaceae bacterium]